jgi:hypothetical protein
MDFAQEFEDESKRSFDPKKGGAISSADLLSNYSSIQFIGNTSSSYNNSSPTNEYHHSLTSLSPTKLNSSSPTFSSWNNTLIVDSHYGLGQFSTVNQVPLSSAPNSSHPAPIKNKWDQPDEMRMNRHPSLTNYHLPMLNARMHMESFVPEKVTDFKHVIYNLLVDNHNNPEKFTFVQPCSIKEKGQTKIGFCFNEKENPDKKLPELYALHIRKARLDMEDSTSVFIQDLYKYYLRACVELLSKYFEKLDKYTYLYEDIHLFLPNGSLEEAEQRMKSMKTRSRKKRMKMAS